MFWVAGGFIFRRVESRFHKLDPRAKLLVSVEFFTVSLLASSVVQVVSVLAAILLVALVARSFVRIARTVAFSSLFAVFIFLLNVVLGTPLENSFVYALRFLAIISSTSIFFVTTSPDELEQTMKWMRVPRDVVFAFVTAVRFIPVIMLDAFQIMDAQKSRGLELEKGNLMRRIRNLIPVLIPLVVNSVIRSGELAEAMESRGYAASSRPTSLYRLTLKWYDWLAIALGLAMTAGALYIYFRIPMPL